MALGTRSRTAGPTDRRGDDPASALMATRRGRPGLSDVAGMGHAAQRPPRPRQEVSVRPPRVLSGRYQLGESLGAGGMGGVYRGHDLRLRREVAIKILKPELIQPGSDVLDRFEQEARAVARLDH